MSGYAWSERAWPAGSALALSHTGVALAGDRVVTGASCDAALLLLDREGAGEERVLVYDACELHDLTAVGEAGEELLWIADTGFKAYGGGPEVVLRESPRGGQVFQVGLDGRRRRTVEQPPIAAYARGGWKPTAVAVDAGEGDVWVADGYGASLVHRFTAGGRHVATLTGEEGAGRFHEPHDVLVAGDELLVADRLNGRIQVYDLEGRFRRTIGDGVLAGPTQMAPDGDRLVVTDILAGRVTVLDAAGALVEHLFPQPAPPAGWEELPAGWPLRQAPLEPGVFHAPHGIAVDGCGTIYVSEFAVGGRVAVLTPPASCLRARSRNSPSAETSSS